MTGQWFSSGTPDSSTNKTDRHNIVEIVLKAVLNTIIISLSLHLIRSKSKNGKAKYINNIWEHEQLKLDSQIRQSSPMREKDLRLITYEGEGPSFDHL